MNTTSCRRPRSRALSLATAGIIAAIGLAPSTQAGSDREPVVDPATLQALGYAPGAPDIYRLRTADGDSDALDRSLGGQPEPSSVSPFPAGTRGWTTATGFAFFPLTHTYEYLKGPSFLVLNGGLISLTAGAVYEAQFNLPHDGRLRWLDIFGFHNDGSRPLTVSLVERCLEFLTPGNPVETVLASADISGIGQNFHVFRGIPDHPLDARRCSYHVRARFSQSDAPVPGLNMQLAKVRAEWIPDRIFVNGFESTATPIAMDD